MKTKSLALAALTCGVVVTPAVAQVSIDDSPPWARQHTSSSVREIVEYARNLPWDVSPWASDAQYLVFRVVDELRAGPFVRIAPRADAHMADTASLVEGRFIGRYESEQAVESLGITRGVTYVWVDREGGEWRSVMFQDPAERDPQRMPLPRDFEVDSTGPVPVLVGGLKVIDVGPQVCEAEAGPRPVGAMLTWREPGVFGSSVEGCFWCDCMLCCPMAPFLEGGDFRGPKGQPPGLQEILDAVRYPPVIR